MKIRVVVQFVLMGLFTFTGAVLAQTGDAVKSEIPFDFYVGTHKMAAGTYFVSLDVAKHEVDIKCADPNGRASMLGTPVSGEQQQSGTPSLEFDHVANDYFLKEVRTPELSLGFDVAKQERLIAGTTAGYTVVAQLGR
jgi:hypothetical protein